MRSGVLLAVSFALVAASVYLENSDSFLSKGLFILSLVFLFWGVHTANRSKRGTGSRLHLLLGVLLPFLLFINYGNPLYLLAVPFLLLPFVSRSERAFLSIVPAGLILGSLAVREGSFVARFVGAFLLAVSIIVGVSFLYFWLKLR
ncbi:hypothetical protein [Thermococcus sp.]|uniref:hypothetical protein n=1 Tax=Thermococcus sp. TaxID=35749 RepID=UPI002628D08F|nr:hypothetical protein [Thermococcus sp.]